jgi:hypothetical protein
MDDISPSVKAGVKVGAMMVYVSQAERMLAG